MAGTTNMAGNARPKTFNTQPKRDKAKAGSSGVSNARVEKAKVGKAKVAAAGVAAALLAIGLFSFSGKDSTPGKASTPGKGSTPGKASTPEKASTPGTSTFSVLTWNTLHTVHTHHNWKNHGQGQEMAESEEQKKQRLIKAAQEIGKLKPDVLLLQEFDDGWRNYAEHDNNTPKKSMYKTMSKSMYKSMYNLWSGNYKTAIYLKNDVWECLQTSEENKPRYVWRIAQHKETKKKVLFVSIHLPSLKSTSVSRVDVLETLLQDLKPYLDKHMPVVLGGDFNETDPEKNLKQLKDLTRIESDANTGLTPDWKKKLRLDYLYYKNIQPNGELEVGEVVAPYQERISASDHAFLLQPFALA